MSAVAIDIKKKDFGISQQDVENMSKLGQGCQLQFVPTGEHQMDDDIKPIGSEQDDESELDEIFEEEKALADKRTQENKMRREFLTLILNANRDPFKPGTKCPFKEFTDDVNDGEFECDTGNLEDRYRGIHRMYENIGNFDEYMKGKEFAEVSPNRVLKLKRMAGVNLPVTMDTFVIYNCALWTEGSKEPFDSTGLRRTTYNVHLASDSILPGLLELLMTCNQGELCEAFIKPEAAFGRLGAGPRVPPNATIFCFLEVVKVITRDKMALLSGVPGNRQEGIKFLDCYEAGQEARRRGNYFYEHDQYRIALQRYKSAIRMLEGVTCKDADEEKLVNGLLLKLYNNCAKTANAMGNPRLALTACKQASEIDDKEPKTWWHRMSAWKLKGHSDRALGVARRALQLFSDPMTVKPFQRAANELKLKIAKEHKDESELYRLMGKAFVGGGGGGGGGGSASGTS